MIFTASIFSRTQVILLEKLIILASICESLLFDPLLGRGEPLPCLDFWEYKYDLLFRKFPRYGYENKPYFMFSNFKFL